MSPNNLQDRLRPLVERPGPFVSLYLNTEAASATGPEELDLRWRALRDRASESGAGDDALGVLDGIVSGSHTRGEGLVAFVAGDELAFRRHLDAPVADNVRVGALPHLVPLLDWEQDHPRYAVVLSDRVGADIHLVGGERDDETVSVEGDEDASKVNPRAQSERRYQNRVENTWEANAKQVADQLATIARREVLDFVIVAGDVRAVQFLQENLVQEVDAIAVELQSEPGSIDDIKEELETSAAAYTARTTKELVEKFQEERGQQDLAVEGLEPTIGALRMAQVDTLLLSLDSMDGSAWFSPSDLTQAALKKSTLVDIGLDDVQEARLIDVLVRAALGTGAKIRILPSLPQDQLPAEGVGGILRYTV